MCNVKETSQKKRTSR